MCLSRQRCCCGNSGPDIGEPSCSEAVHLHNPAKRDFPMSAAPFSQEEFAVLHFSLVPSEEGKPMQKAHACGIYKTIEEAFVAARMLAVREWQRLRALASAGSTASSMNWQVIDTEFGYDLKRDNLVVARFWIHARAVPRV